jgi:hypothetical protein
MHDFISMRGHILVYCNKACLETKFSSRSIYKKEVML